MIVFGCSAIGINIALSMRKRINNLRDIERIINLLKSEIFYKHSILKEAFKNASLRCIYPYNKWFESVSLALEEGKESFFDIWVNELEFIYCNTCLNQEDIKLLRGIGQALGHFDRDTQEVNINLELEEIHITILNLDKGLAGRIKVATFGGILGGIIIVLLMA